MKFNCTGKSLLELREQYGVSENGFYNQAWYLDEAFAKNKPEAGTYDIDFGGNTRNKTFEEQQKGIKQGFEVSHPAVIAEALLLHHAKTGIWLCADYWVRTSLLDSRGGRVAVGGCDAGGVAVRSAWDGGRGGAVGVGASRKFNMRLGYRNLEFLDSLDFVPRSEFEEFKEKVEKVLKL